jgi:hypothetical protein
MSTLEVDSIVASNSNTDLSLDGAGSGVVNLATGAKLNGTALTSTFNPYVAPGTSGNLLTSNGSAWTSAAPAAGGSMVLIATSVASNSANLTITGLDDTYATYLVIGDDLRPATDNQNMHILLGDSGGIDSGGADYAWGARTNMAIDGTSSTTATYTGDKDNSDSKMVINDSNVKVGNAATESASFHFYIHAGNGTGLPRIQGRSVYPSGSAEFQDDVFAGHRKAVIAVTQVQFLFASGNVTSGRMSVWGIAHA